MFYGVNDENVSSRLTICVIDYVSIHFSHHNQLKFLSVEESTPFYGSIIMFEKCYMYSILFPTLNS